MKKLNNFSDHLKFTFESNKQRSNFLDVKINLPNGHLMTNIHIKPRVSSAHSNHIKHSIVSSQSHRDRTLCSLESDFLKLCTKMKSWSGHILAVSCMQKSHRWSCPFSKYFQILCIFAQIFKYLGLFCPFSEKSHACLFFLK